MNWITTPGMITIQGRIFMRLNLADDAEPLQAGVRRTADAARGYIRMRCYQQSSQGARPSASLKDRLPVVATRACAQTR